MVKWPFTTKLLSFPPVDGHGNPKYRRKLSQTLDP